MSVAALEGGRWGRRFGAWSVGKPTRKLVVRLECLASD